MFKRRYEDELEYLRSLQQDFAQQYPEAAAELNLFGDDPELRRLTQGFSFLAAHTLDVIEHVGDVLVHPMIQHVWPQTLRPTPACGLMEFKPQPGILQQANVIPRGFLLKTEPDVAYPCTFQTTASVTVYPVSLKALELEGRGPQQSRITLQFDIFPATQLAHEGRGPLRLQLVDRVPAGEVFAMALRRRLSALHLKVFVGPQLEKVVDRPVSVRQLRPLGMEEDEALLPHKTAQAMQQRHLHEWLIFPAKFRTFGFYGLERLATLQALRQFTLELTLDVDPAQLSGLTTEDVRLHCVPAINLFPNTVRVNAGDSSQAEYRLPTDHKTPESIQLYSVEGIRGSKRAGLTYHPFMAHLPHLGDDESSVRYFRVRETPALVPHRLGHRAATSSPPADAEDDFTEQRTLHYLSIVDGKGLPSKPERLLNISLTCCNGMATRFLKAEQLNVPLSSLDAGILLSGIGVLTEPASAPVELPLQWDGMRYFRRAAEQLRSLAELKQTLYVYAGTCLQHAPFLRRLEALLAALHEVRVVQEAHVLGVPPGLMSGHHHLLTLREGLVEVRPELELLGEALYRHLRALAPRGRCVRVSICAYEGTSLLEWATAEGERALM